ncbi:MAG: hypothetical protein Q4A31_11205, partial [Corynebacterium sp.]|uniref:hypothetical protein n=1 Tax=Corynebacterium sp. TaxID=1720 RepID=UPI0026DC74B9
LTLLLRLRLRQRLRKLLLKRHQLRKLQSKFCRFALNVFNLPRPKKMVAREIFRIPIFTFHQQRR